MDWKNPEVILPGLTERVIVKTEEGSELFAKRVFRSDGIKGEWWIDDQSIPVKAKVVAWARTVSKDETA